jgi:hypothetical protein
VSALSPKLGHHPWRALHLLHQLEEQRHGLVELFLANEDAALELIENYPNV